MKKLIIPLLMLIAMISTVSAFSGSGSGTIGDPYQITNATQMAEIDDDLNAAYILMNDIDVSGGELGDGIGDWFGTQGFNGSFNGGGYSITGFSYDVGVGGSSAGIFNYVIGGEIKNVDIVDVTVAANWSQFPGGLIGFFEGESLNVTNIGLYNVSISGGVGYGLEWPGLLIGGLLDTSSGFSVFIENITIYDDGVTYSEVLNYPTAVYGAEIGGLIGRVDGYGALIINNLFVGDDSNNVGVIYIHNENTEISSIGLIGQILESGGQLVTYMDNVSFGLDCTGNATDFGALVGLSGGANLTISNMYIDASACYGMSNETYDFGIGRDPFSSGIIACTDTVAIQSPYQLYDEDDGCDITGFSGGAGTVGDPYQVTTCQELQLMNFYLDAHYIMMNDINCSESSAWNSGQGFYPVGHFDVSYNEYPFTGSFDGQLYEISDLYFDYHSYNDVFFCGLFGFAREASFNNIGFIDPYVNCSYPEESWGSAGVLLAYGEGVNISKAYMEGGYLETDADVGLIAAVTSYSGPISIISDVYGLGYTIYLHDSLGGHNAGLISFLEGSSTLDNAYASYTYSDDGSPTQTFYGVVDNDGTGVVNNSFYDCNITGLSCSGDGISDGKTTLEMYAQSTYTGFDFVSTWGIDEGVSTPYLLSELPVMPECDGVNYTNLNWCWTDSMTVQDAGLLENVNITINESGWVSFYGNTTVTGTIYAHIYSGWDNGATYLNHNDPVFMNVTTVAVDGEIYIFDGTGRSIMTIVNPNGYNIDAGFGGYVFESEIGVYLGWAAQNISGTIDNMTLYAPYYTEPYPAYFTGIYNITSQPTLNKTGYVTIDYPNNIYNSSTDWYLYKDDVLQIEGIDYDYVRHDQYQTEFYVYDPDGVWKFSTTVLIPECDADLSESTCIVTSNLVLNPGNYTDINVTVQSSGSTTIFSTGAADTLTGTIYFTYNVSNSSLSRWAHDDTGIDANVDITVIAPENGTGGQVWIRSDDGFSNTSITFENDGSNFWNFLWKPYHFSVGANANHRIWYTSSSTHIQGTWDSSVVQESTYSWFINTTAEPGFDYPALVQFDGLAAAGSEYLVYQDDVLMTEGVDYNLSAQDADSKTIIVSGFSNWTLALPPITYYNYTYDFDNCSSLRECYVTPIGYLAGSVSVTTFGGDSVLYYNGMRHSASPYENYILGFMATPLNITTLEYMIYPIDATYSEVYVQFRENATDTASNTKISIYNTDYYNYAALSYDFDGTESNTSCSKYPVGQWNKVRLVLDYAAQTVTYYLNDVMDCQLDWSGDAADVVNLGEYVMLRTSSSDSPNVYFDNITMTSNIEYTLNDTAPVIIPGFVSGVDLAYDEYQTYSWTANDTDDVYFETMTGTWYLNGSQVGTGASYTVLGWTLAADVYNLTIVVSDGLMDSSYEWDFTVAPFVQYNGTNVTYDFENCSTLIDCRLAEVGYNYGLGQSYITSFGGSNTLYYNGVRHGASPYENYVLQFLDVPMNTSTVEFDVYPVDASYAEFSLQYRADNVLTTSGNPLYKLQMTNTDYSNYVTMTTDFDGTEYTTSCTKLTVGQWNHVKLEFNYSTQTFAYYKDGVFNCAIDWSGDAADVGNLADLAMLRTSTADTPNIYLDNITFSILVNSPPSIVNASPVSGVNLTNDESQNYSVTIIDNDGDTDTTWYLNGSEVATGLAYAAVANDLGTGSYHLSFVINDTLYNDSYDWYFSVYLNIAPVIDSQNPAMNQSIYNGGSILLSVSASDANNDSLSYQWEIDGDTIADAAVSSYSYTPAYMVTGLKNISVNVFDTYNASDSAYWLVNVSYYATDVLSAIIADSSTTTLRVDWTDTADTMRIYVDGVFRVQSSLNSYLIESLSPATEYELTLVPVKDGYYGEPISVNGTTSVSDDNAPVMVETFINPTTGYTDTVFIGSCRATDIDTQDITYTYTWYVNGISVKTGTTTVATQGTTKSIGTLLTTNYVKGDNLTLSCVAHDGLSSSAELNDSLIIQNSPATIADIFLIQVNATNYLCNHTYADADNDPQITPSYTWYLDGVPTGNTSSTVPISQFSPGDEISCAVTTGDGIGPNVTANSSTFIVGDTNPPDYLRVTQYSVTAYTDTAVYLEVECEDDEDNIGGGYPVLRMIDPNLVQRQYSFFWSGDPSHPDRYYRYITYSVAGDWTDVNIQCCDGNGNCIDVDQPDVSSNVRQTVINVGGGGGSGGETEDFRDITSFNVIPDSINFNVAPGQSVISEVEIENTDIVAIAFTVTSIRSEVTPETYQWIEFADNKRSASFTIAAQGGLEPSNRFLTYTVDVPADTPEGTYYGSIEVTGFDQTEVMDITITVRERGIGLLGFLQQELFTIPSTRTLITGDVISGEATGTQVSLGLLLIVVVGLVGVGLIARGAIRQVRKR